MKDKTRENNSVRLRGVLQEDFSFSHNVYGEDFYNSIIAVERLSGTVDNIPVMLSGLLFDTQICYAGVPISIIGEYRSYNEHTAGRSKLRLYVFVKEVIFFEEADAMNEIVIDGYLCKTPTYRKTPFGREITDILLANNRRYDRSFYIPCICWEKIASFVKNLEVGTYIKIQGRIQSREYRKWIEENVAEVRTAYEVSITKIDECVQPYVEINREG